MRWSAPIIIFCVAFIPRWSLAHTLDLVTDEATYIPAGRFDSTAAERQSSKSLLACQLRGALTAEAHHGRRLADWQHTRYAQRLSARRTHPWRAARCARIVLAYWLARPIFGRTPALIGALALALSPWAAYFAAIAYLDSYLLDFVTIAILLTWHAARKPWLLPVVAVLLALGFDSKYTGAFAALPVTLYLAYYYACEVRRRPPWQYTLWSHLVRGALSGRPVDLG